MIHFLLGSDDEGRSHLHVVSTPDENVPWSTGVQFTGSHESEFVVDTYAALLGAGSDHISTVSFVVSADLDPDWSLLPPRGPLGDPRQSGGGMQLTIIERDERIRMTFATPVIPAGTSFELADTHRVRLLVMTHTMGRAEMVIDHLVCTS